MTTNNHSRSGKVVVFDRSSSFGSDDEERGGGALHHNRPHTTSGEVIGRWISSAPVPAKSQQQHHQPPPPPQQLYYDYSGSYGDERNPLIPQQQPFTYGAYSQQPLPPSPHSYQGQPMYPPGVGYPQRVGGAPVPTNGAPYPSPSSVGATTEPSMVHSLLGYGVGRRQGGRNGQHHHQQSPQTNKQPSSKTSQQRAPFPSSADSNKDPDPSYYLPVRFGGEEAEGGRHPLKQSPKEDKNKKSSKSPRQDTHKSSSRSPMQDQNSTSKSTKQDQQPKMTPKNPTPRHNLPKHRRVYSDAAATRKRDHPLLRPSLKKSSSFSKDEIPPMHGGHRRRLSSSDKFGLPPVAPSSKGHHHRRSSSRGSTFSETFRRRGDSFSSAVSMTSSMSVGSYLTDITKSALFKGVSETGMAQFHLPKDSVHIVMEKDLEPGKVYREVPPDENERFLEYYLFASDANHYWQDLLGEDDEVHGGCTCNCDYCAACTNRQHDLLPDSTYAIAVKDDLYKRVFKEVADSRWMPCGLYFCGHHEEFGHPNVLIAGVIVFVLFVAMGLVAVYFND